MNKTWFKYSVILIFLINLNGLFLYGSQNETMMERVSDQKLVQFVHKSVLYSNKYGKEKALSTFSRLDKESPFQDGELYIYAYNYQGKVLAHGANPKLIGKNLLDLKDATGQLVIQALVNQAKKGKGFVDYTWPYPTNLKQIWYKRGYVEKVDHTYFVGSGVYTKPVDNPSSQKMVFPK